MEEWKKQKLDLARSLFYGENARYVYHNDHIADQNRALIRKFSTKVAEHNKPWFKKLTEQKISEELRAFIKEAEEPLEDRFGRCTFFYVDIGGTKLPIYQPGTVMFDSAVKDGKMAVHHGGS